MDKLNIIVPNRMSALNSATMEVRDFLDNRGLPERPSYAVLLALEEFVTNAIKYGYDDNGLHRIELCLMLEPGHVVLSMVDDGHEFDPTSAPSPPGSETLTEVAIGGLGIHMVKRLAKSMSYNRIDERNHLEIRFSL